MLKALAWDVVWLALWNVVQCINHAAAMMFINIFATVKYALPILRILTVEWRDY